MNSPISQGSFCGRAARKSLVATAFLAALLSLGVAAFAQDDQSAPPPPPASDQQSGQSGPGMGRHMGGRQMMSVDDQIKHLSKKLNLSADQEAKLKPILEDQRKQMEAVHNDSSLSRQDKFSKMQDLRKSSDDQIKCAECRPAEELRQDAHGTAGSHEELAQRWGRCRRTSRRRQPAVRKRTSGVRPWTSDVET
jgi:protein CpxP